MGGVPDAGSPVADGVSGAKHGFGPGDSRFQVFTNIFAGVVPWGSLGTGFSDVAMGPVGRRGIAADAEGAECSDFAGVAEPGRPVMG